MSQTNKFAFKFAIRSGVLVVAALALSTVSLAGLGQTDAQEEGALQAGVVELGTRVREDALFGDGFGSLAIDFTLANPQPNLVEVWSGTFASGDVDGG